MYRSFHDVTYLVTSYKEPPLCVSVYAFELYKGATSPYRHTLMSDQERIREGAQSHMSSPVSWATESDMFMRVQSDPHHW